MRSSMAGDASAATIRKGQSRKQERPPESARRPAYGDVDGQAPTHEPTGEQNQKQRTFDVLPKPANLISYRQARKSVRSCAHAGLEGSAAEASTPPTQLMSRSC